MENVLSSHPLGEVKVEPLSWPVDTPGGRYWAEFDDQAAVTREGQLIFFAQFLHTGGRWEQFVEKSPLTYTGMVRGDCGYGNEVLLQRGREAWPALSL